MKRGRRRALSVHGVFEISLPQKGLSVVDMVSSVAVVGGLHREAAHLKSKFNSSILYTPVHATLNSSPEGNTGNHVLKVEVELSIRCPLSD